MRFTSTQQMLNHPAVKRRMVQRVKINHKYDVPGFAACSKNGRIVYIDRDLPEYYKEVRDYAIVRDTLVRQLHIDPWIAKHIAIETLGDSLRNLGSFIKPLHNLRRLPPDLNLKVYEPHHARVFRWRMKRKKVLDKAKQLDYTKEKRVNNVDRNLYESWVSSLPKN